MISSKWTQLFITFHFPYIFHRKPRVHENLPEVIFTIPPTDLTEPD